MNVVAWSGKGWIVALCNAAGFGIAWAVTNLVLHLDTRTHVAVLFGLWGVLSGLGVYVASRRIESAPARTLVDPATGDRHELIADAGSFTWLPTRWWALLNPFFGLLVTVLVLMQVFDPVSLFGEVGPVLFLPKAQAAAALGR